ncbi:MAG: extracellular solute-binding protein, partial [Lachnospiraceae bacterium]|nr:extracellular solute-binding protein [Lachnospiraceae bacterium]
MKKALALILALLLILGTFAACSGENSSQSGTSSDTPSSSNVSEGEDAAEGTRNINGLQLPISTTGEELRVFYAYNGSVVEDLNTIESVKKMEEATGVHINWIPIPLSELQEKFNTLVTSGEYPDIVMLSFFPTYPGGWAKGVEDGVIMNMEQLVQDYMPNYRAALEQNDFGAKQSLSDDHEHLIFYSLQGTDDTIEGEGVVSGLGYRADILEKLGLDEPTTIDELHDVLVKVKESGIEYPFMPATNGTSELLLGYGLNYSAWTLNTDGKIVHTYTQPDFKLYLDEMKKWYSEGLIDPNFTSFNFFQDLPVSVETDANFLYAICLGFGHELYNTGRISNSEAFIQPYLAPAVTVPETVKAYAQEVTKNPGFITTSCENPELAAKWLDYLYTDETMIANWYGTEGVTFEYDENGKPQYLGESLNDNPDGIPASDYLQKICLCNNYAGSTLGRANNEAGRKITAALIGETEIYQEEVVEYLSSPATNVSIPAGTLLTDEEGYIVNQYETDITTLSDEFMVKYIIGSTDQTFEEFVESANKYHLQEVIDCYQAA